MIKYIPLVFLLGCATVEPETQPAPMPVKTLVAYKQSADMPDEVAHQLQPPTNLKLVWTYYLPMPVIGVGFDIETTPDIDHPNWVLYCSTNQPPVPIWPTNTSAFFRVGAHCTSSPECYE